MVMSGLYIVNIKTSNKVCIVSKIIRGW